MGPLAIAAALGAAGLISGVTSSVMNQVNTNRAFHQQENQYEDQKKYNSAMEQVQRLRAAGLNPALTYGTGSSEVSAGGLPSPLPQTGLDLNGISSLISTPEQINNLKANTDKQGLEAQAQGITNNRLDAKLLSEIKSTKMDTWLKKQLGDSTKLDIQYNKLAMNDRLRQLKTDIAYKDSLTTSQDLQNMYLPVKLPQEVNESIARQINLYKTGQASLKSAHAAIMQAANNAHAFDAQYGGTPVAREKYFNATLNALIQSKETAKSQEERNYFFTPDFHAGPTGVTYGQAWRWNKDTKEFKRY